MKLSAFIVAFVTVAAGLVSALPPVPPKFVPCDANGGIDTPAVKGVSPRLVSKCVKPGMFALTFDDGVNKYEPELLDKLRKHDVKVTFFLNSNLYVNNSATPYNGWIKRMYDEGHQVATHTATHPNLVGLNSTQRFAELKEVDRVIGNIIHRKPAMMRPPYGSYDNATLADLAKYGIETAVLWNVDSGDWSHNNATQSFLNVKTALETNCPTKGSSSVIILSHSSLSSSVEYVDLIIPYVRKRGYRFVRLDECTGARAYLPEKFPKPPQEGQLCAQHALNALLGGPYFTAVDLAEIARQLDVEEHNAMSEGNIGGVESEDFKRYVKEGSSNYDDSGFFSVQVISQALSVWNLVLCSILAPEQQSARDDPTSEQAYICNLNEHWFTLRRFGGSPRRWYNLNSLLEHVEYVSETYLQVLLAQLQKEGYSIFVVRGILPETEADLTASIIPTPTQEDIDEARVLSAKLSSGSKRKPIISPMNTSDSDPELLMALEMSRSEFDGGDDTLNKALKMSMETAGTDEESLNLAIAASLGESQKVGDSKEATPEVIDFEEMRRRRLAKFG
ncbi:Ataxin-3 [Nowakowskiella sp. JEL0407]|nr:Ataxin-3 [Nowakowskiella sp. JEL0407]